ncbi:MAG: LuxR C-terminal-related transcriptional regulator [Solirubrobacteraceae bacterium]
MPAHLHLATESDGPLRAGAGPIKVVLAVDHAALRRNLRHLIDRDEGAEVIAESSDLAAATRSALSRSPEVIVVDLQLAGQRTGDAIRGLHEQVPDVEIVVLTMEESPLTAQQAIDAGAIGFVLKDRADSELLPAIHSAARREEFVSLRVSVGLDALRRAMGDGLSPRETEIVRLIALGYTSAEIAAMLDVSRRTVETQRARVYEKLGLTSRAGLVQFALRRRLIGC